MAAKESAARVQLRIYAREVDRTVEIPIEQPIYVGRDDDCQVVLPSPSVSRKHLSLFVREGRLLVRDHSSNGTRIAGQLLHLATRELQAAEDMQVGPYKLTASLTRSSARDNVIARS
jgi:pSer/pThr/pTyr-binding forkhead associated (FHA) protein